MSPVALDERARDELRRYRSRAWPIAVAGVVVLAAVVVFVIRTLDQRAELQESGARTPGVVTGVDRGRDDSVEVEFDRDGHRDGRIYVAEASSYEIGDRVTVLVDRDDPGRVSLQGEDNYPPWGVGLTIGATTVGVTALVTGAGARLRAARQQRVLSRGPWRRLTITYREIPARQGTVRPLLLARDDAHPAGVVLTVVSLNQWRLGKLGLRGATVADVAGPLPGYVVIRAPGHDGLVSARAPWRRRDERRWREALEQEPDRVT